MIPVFITIFSIFILVLLYQNNDKQFALKKIRSINSRVVIFARKTTAREIFTKKYQY